MSEDKHTLSLNGITIKATYKYDHYTQYGFQCGKCGYDAGSKLTVPMEECPKCNPELKTSEISDAVKSLQPERYIADVYYDGYANLPKPIRSKLSLNDLHQIFIHMAKPAIIYAEGIAAKSNPSNSHIAEAVEGRTTERVSRGD